MSVFVGVRIDEETVKAIDARSQNRSAFIVEAVREKLGTKAEEPRAIEPAKAKRPKMIMAKPERQEPMKVEPPKVETSRPSHAETCRCGICQLRKK